MSGFKALNIESDDESDVEIDDTKELQIEEALKLYQTALKYHADGPASFELAAEAYDNLFKSDIFQYPESQIELRRLELYDPATETEDFWLNDYAAVTAVTTGVLEGGPSTLPQILHLSHKNYGQFKLEYLTARLDELAVTVSQILNDAATALEHFVHALDKDDTDLDLWRRTASVGGMLDSKRVARYCLEAVLDGDEEGLGSVLSLPGLDEDMAGEQLRQLVHQLEDHLSFVQAWSSTTKRKPLSKILTKRLLLYPSIDEREKILHKEMPSIKPLPPQRALLAGPKRWSDLGKALLERQAAEQRSANSAAPALAIGFDEDTAAQPELETAMVVDAEPLPGEAVQSQADEATSNPQSIDAQFPGRDGGLPTAQPQIANAEEDASVPHENGDEDGARTDRPRSPVSMPTRKRSGDAAGLNDGNDEVRIKSKRTRTRESIAAEDSKQSIIDANTLWEYEQQLNEFQAADDWMFDTIGALFERIGVIGFDASKEVRQALLNAPSEGESPMTEARPTRKGLDLVKADLHAFLSNYTDYLGNILTSENSDLKPGSGYDESGPGGQSGGPTGSRTVARPADLPDEGLSEFIEMVNLGWLTTQDVAWEWITRLLRPQSLEHERNSYVLFTWSEELKTTVVRTLVDFDAHFYKRASALLDSWKEPLRSSGSSGFESGLIEMIETIFELHLDVYCLIKEDNSGVDSEAIKAQQYRLQRWSQMAREAMYLRSGDTDILDFHDELNIRFIWTTTFHLGASSDVEQEHVIECMNDLRRILLSANEPVIQLQNNAVMSDVSVAALDREISRLTTRDFFLKVTSDETSDPVAVIESLEPLLEALEASSDVQDSAMPSDEEKSSHFAAPELVRYVQESDFSVRLLLWHRLRDAYTAIDYKPMVLSCYFRMIKMVLDEMKRQVASLSLQSDRQVVVIKGMSLIRDMIVHSLALIQNNSNALECIDAIALKSTTSTFGEILQLVQVFNVFQDSIRVGLSQPPTLLSGLTVASFDTLGSKLHDMQIHIWLVLYALLKDAMVQFEDLYPTPKEDRFDFLRVVHRNMGLRGICGHSNRALVRLLKDEFFQMTDVEGYDSEQSQVLYDLYGLNCFVDPNYELIEHQCTHDAFLDRGVAMQVVDLLLTQASKLPVKDLVKHPLRDTIDKVHASAPRKKPTDAILRNREVYRAYLRSPVQPLDLYSCLKGEGNELAVSPIPKEDALLASKGWYFLMGNIALSKFRSQKRTAPTPTEDVDIAIAFFMQDLEYSMDNWETWFRLAQAYDTKIEESVVWSAEKLNNSMSEVVQLQKAAIHCYTMAMALAYRSAEATFETSEKMTELYYDFALRIYASSREPFGMLPFAMEENDKFLSVPGAGIGKGKPYQPLRPYTAWKLAKNLFQRSLGGRSQMWVVHFMLGKCMWKMHCAKDRLATEVAPTPQEILDSFIRAIELIPDKKDSREKREPILEPHYKLVSIVHKLVSRGGISLEQANQALGHTPYARTLTSPTERELWVPHVLAVLKNLRTADKANWHHRMIMRAATIIYGDRNAEAKAIDGQRAEDAARAKHELTQQMFTKTMVLQVWRPECERAGRHFVFTARYTRFFVRILEQLKDRSNLEMLARRVRRRPNEIFEHGLVWQDICSAYLRLLRGFASIAEGLETSTFSNIAHEDFLMRKEPLERWMQAQDNDVSPALDVLREVQELKKINQSLMKPGPIDDLIGDSYAHLFTTIGKQLWEDERRLKQEEEDRARQEEEARRAPPPPPITSPQRNPMMSLTHLMNTDGGDSTSTPSASNPVPAAAPTPQPSAAAEPAAAPAARRKIGVGRREIRACAEACHQRAGAAAAAAASATLARTGGKLPGVEVVINASRRDVTASSGDVSMAGSVHDSADDESELSSLEEEGMDDEDDEDDEEKENGVGDGDGDEEMVSAIAPSSPIPDATATGDETPPQRRPLFPGLEGHFMDSRAASEAFETADEAISVAIKQDEDVKMGDANVAPTTPK